MNGSGVSGTRCDKPITLETFTSVGEIPTDAQTLLGGCLFDSVAWWRCVEAEAMPPGSTPCYLLSRAGRQPVALLPLRRWHDDRLESLTTPYTCRFGPATDDGAAPAVDAALRAIMRFCRHATSTRLDALDEAQMTTAALGTAARGVGLLPLRFAHFGNWYEAVGAYDWPRYLAGRPGALRETIRRRLRDADRSADAALTVIDTPAGLAEAIAAYETVYDRSWKVSEPFPRFNTTLMRALAPSGALRLGVWRIDGQPAAAQFWVVEQGRANLLKLAHDEAFKVRSPGTVLTALMIRRMLEQDDVRELDLGRGDDPYKRGWARQRRGRIGILLVNPLRPAAWPVLGRHIVGRLMKSRSGAAKVLGRDRV